MIKGGCFCGKIRYAITEKQEGKYLVANCHCSMCRRTSAAPFVTWIIVPKDAFEFTQGNPTVLQSSPKATRRFCGDCGTPIAFRSNERPENIDVTTCSLDQPELFVPTVSVHEDSKLKWLHMG